MGMGASVVWNWPYTPNMPYGAKERRIRREAKKRGIKSIRTVDLPDGEYAHVYVVREPGKRGGHTVMGNPKKRKGQ